MDAEPDVARIARTLGDPTRIRMLTLLMEGRALTAKELAYGTGVEPATATSHLRRLVADRLVFVRPEGRHKYFELTSARVAACVESLLVLAPTTVRSPSISTPHPLRAARFCYDHLAGRLAVQLKKSLVERRYLILNKNEFIPTARGKSWLAEFGIDPVTLAQSRRKFAPGCMDWSERQDHIGGALGAALAQQLLKVRWIKRQPGSRAVVVTSSGQVALAKQFGIPPPGAEREGLKGG